ncbi:hypothetical protein [Brevundimonas vesicularis]|uniref:hypothetical protein n=1 Tax=Brevundimonas vesicularis TaxID=41276 RepID=UPI0038D36739
MKHCVATAAVCLTVGLAGCDESGGTVPEAAAGQTVAEASQAPVPTPLSGDAIPGAPSFVALYPGAEVIVAENGGPARQLVFTTEAPPDTVIDFYRQRAESSGLYPTAAMNQGLARAYGASDRAESGASLQVVASPTESGLTTVQLNWNVAS